MREHGLNPFSCFDKKGNVGFHSFWLLLYMVLSVWYLLFQTTLVALCNWYILCYQWVYNYYNPYSHPLGNECHVTDFDKVKGMNDST